jgi:nitroimidazol reductase NimA-like FMN-containing flavoprotein (pyridoxamine 5'-phosphate oxidase superfamily)
MDFDKASRFWIDKEAGSKAAPDAKDRLKMFIQEHKVCALATGSGEYVRCTPIEYNFVDGAFYLFSEGGMKFKGLKDNKNVCLAIFDASDKVGFGELHSAQISGTAELVEPFSEEYLKLLQYKHIPEEMIRKMPEPIHLIKITPVEAEFLDTDFKKDGYNARQKVIFE